MFETVKFGFHAGTMLAYGGLAAMQKKFGNDQKAMLLLKKAMRAGHKALIIQSPKIKQQARTAVQNGISYLQKAYQFELIAQLPEDDRELIVSVMKSWADMRIVTFGIHPIDQMISMFKIAKDRLDKGSNVLEIIYKGDHVPTPLQNIMQSFLAGETTHEETSRRLDECMEKLAKWLPELLSAQ